MNRVDVLPPVLIHRWWLPLLLFLMAQPLPLSASGDAPAEERITTVRHPHASPARGGSALEILQALEGSTGSGTIHSGNGPASHPARGTTGFADHHGLRSGALPPLVRVVPPVCERLPYDATAPPAPR